MKKQITEFRDQLEEAIYNSEKGTQIVLTLSNVPKCFYTRPDTLIKYAINKVKQKHGKDTTVVCTLNVCHAKYINDSLVSGYPEMTFVIVISA